MASQKSNWGKILIGGAAAFGLAICAVVGKHYLDSKAPEEPSGLGRTEVRSLSNAPARDVEGMTAAEVMTYMAEHGHRPDAISVNEATVEQFMEIGMTRTLAERIVERRNQRLGITSIDELRYVKGMGPQRLERYRPFLKL